MNNTSFSGHRYEARCSLIAAQIQTCDFILSSSLHGCIFSDLLGVPNTRVVIGDNVIGGRFKFDDYRLGLSSSLYPDISLFDYSSSIRDLESLRLSTSIVDYEIITKTALDLRNILFAFIHNLRIPSSSHNICRGKEPPNSFNG